MDNNDAKKIVENMNLLSNEELDKLNFHELCLYLGILDEMEHILESEE